MSFIPLSSLRQVAQELGDFSFGGPSIGLAFSDPDALEMYGVDWATFDFVGAALHVRNACLGCNPRQCDLWRKRADEKRRKGPKGQLSLAFV